MNRRAIVFAILIFVSGGLLIGTPAVSAGILKAKAPDGWTGFTTTLKKAKLKHYTGFAAGALSVKVMGKKEINTTSNATIYSNLTAADSTAALKLCKRVAAIAKRTKNLTVAFNVVAENIPTTGRYDAQIDGPSTETPLAAMSTTYQCTTI